VADESEIAGLLSSSGLDPRRRAETLSIEEIARLADSISKSEQRARPALFSAPF
jgi:hypothetical protein